MGDDSISVRKSFRYRGSDLPPIIICALARGVRSPSVIATSFAAWLNGEAASCRPGTGDDWKFMGDDDFGG